MRTYLGEFEQLLLFVLLLLDHDAYGARIRQAIEARTGRVVSPGAIYTALDRLQRRELVASWLGEPTASEAANANVITPWSLPAPRCCGGPTTRSADGPRPKPRLEMS